jgi:hypothetical protein
MFLLSLDTEPSMHPVAWANLLPLYEQKIPNLGVVGIASNKLAPESAIGVEARLVALRVLLDCRSASR